MKYLVSISFYKYLIYLYDQILCNNILLHCCKYYCQNIVVIPLKILFEIFCDKLSTKHNNPKINIILLTLRRKFGKMGLRINKLLNINHKKYSVNNYR